MEESWPRWSVHNERSEVCTHDRGQDSPTQTDLVMIRCLLYGKNKNNLIRLMLLVCTNWHFARERRWAEINSSKVCSSSLLFFFLISFLALTEINIVRWKQSMILHFSLQLFQFKILSVYMLVWMGKSRLRSISISANQIREFGSSQSLWDRAV